jgi:hypothetical protein
MRRAARLALALLLGAAAAPADDAVPERLAPWLDASADRRLARAYVPSPARRVGEVRILRRGEATVVQTLLYSKVLRRVVGEIRKKELANWADHPDCAAYLEALSRAQQTIWRRMPKDRDLSDRRQKMWIEFVLAPDAALIGIGAFEMAEDDGEVRVVRRETLAVLEPSREYVSRNQRLIAADSLPGEDAARALEPEGRQ